MNKQSALINEESDEKIVKENDLIEYFKVPDMRKMTTQIETIVNAYKTLAKIPTLSSARLQKSGKLVTSVWSERNVERGKSTKFSYDFVLDDKFQVVSESQFASDVSNELLTAVSSSEKYRAVIKEQTDTTKKQYLEIWQAHRMAQCIDLSALEIHGDVYADSEFGSFQWSPDEKSLVYIAEKKLTKSEPFIKRKSLNKEKKVDNDPDTENSNDALLKVGAGTMYEWLFPSSTSEGCTVETQQAVPADQNQGEEYVYRQDWGEQLIGKYKSVIVVVELETEKFTVISDLPESWCPGQVCWSPEGDSLIATVWDTEPRRLGLIFCTNRPSAIVSITLDGKYKSISAEKKAVRSPRFSSDNKSLVWLERDAGGPHHACLQIVKVQWPLQDKPVVSIVLDKVDTEIKSEGGEPFYGVYSQSLPQRGFSTDAKRLIFSTNQSTEIRSYVLNIESNKVTDISDRSAPGSTTVLDVLGDIVLASRSSQTTPSQIVIACLPAAGSEHAISWQTLGEANDVPDVISTASVHYLDLQQDSKDAVTKFSAIYFAPTVQGSTKLPLIVWPHGGPHSASANSYSLEASLFAMLGFASLQINYRGSVGFGQSSVDFLLGRAGSADVLDCKLAADTVLKQFAVDAQKVALYGGSHGGFLVTHLSGQYPDSFAVVVARNAVIDVASMINSTDIPDWCAVEAGFDFTESGPISEEQLLAMRRASPIVHAHKVKAPTAIMLGSGDKRVPHYQGLEYQKRLKANGCKTRIFLYEDNHSLASLPVEIDNVINGCLWMLQHTQ